ncbi:MAG: TRAP transporter small permease [Candidatus Eiseniibacteriota bacterium]
MTGLAETLARFLAGLPPLGPFAAVCGAVCLMVAGALFAVRRSAPVILLRDRLEMLIDALLAANLLAMVFLSGLQILLRNLLDSGLLWIDPVLRHLVLLLALTGAIAATGRKRHVQINVLGRLLRGTAQRIAGAAVAAFAGIVALMLAHASLLLLADEVAFPEVAFLSVPAWVIIAALPVAFLVLAYRFAWLLFAEIAGEAPRAPEVEVELELPAPTGHQGTQP